MNPNQNINPDNGNNTPNIPNPQNVGQDNFSQGTPQLNHQTQPAPANSQAQINQGSIQPVSQGQPGVAPNQPQVPVNNNIQPQVANFNNNGTMPTQPQTNFQQTPIQPSTTGQTQFNQPNFQQPPPTGPVNPGLVDLNNRKLKKKTILIISIVAVVSVLVALIFLIMQFAFSTIDLSKRETISEDGYSVEVPKGFTKLEDDDLDNGSIYANAPDKKNAVVAQYIYKNDVDDVGWADISESEKDEFRQILVEGLKMEFEADALDGLVKDVEKIENVEVKLVDHEGTDAAYQVDFKLTLKEDDLKAGGSCRVAYYFTKGKAVATCIIGYEEIVKDKQDEINEILDTLKLEGS